VLLPAVRRSSLSGNVLAITGCWDDYLASLKGGLRKRLRKNWRIFTEHEGAAFRRIDDPDEAARVLTVLEAQQAARLRALGQPYRLDEPAFAAFYRRITVDGIADGSVVLTALMRGDEVVATLLGLARADTYVMVRTSVGAQRWAHCSPGRLVILQTLHMLHGEGYRRFDFSVGDYPYKQRLGAHRVPVFDLTVALTPRGVPSLAHDRAKQFVRQRPWLHGLVRRMARRSGGSIRADDDRG
jgi:CelD/BcsL family acetyltransferase involved in cellulose biosynthesis